MTRPDEVRIGETGDPIVAEVGPAFGIEGFWMVTLWRRNSAKAAVVSIEEAS